LFLFILILIIIHLFILINIYDHDSKSKLIIASIVSCKRTRYSCIIYIIIYRLDTNRCCQSL